MPQQRPKPVDNLGGGGFMPRHEQRDAGIEQFRLREFFALGLSSRKLAQEIFARMFPLFFKQLAQIAADSQNRLLRTLQNFHWRLVKSLECQQRSEERRV